MLRMDTVFYGLGRMCMLAVTFLLLVPVSSSAEALSKKDCSRTIQDPPFVSLAALYRQDLEASYLKGICQALKKHKHGPRVHVGKFPYGNEDTAFKELARLLKGKDTDIVLGPTDSGVFLRAIRELGETNTTAIVSPLVTADYDFNSKTLLFATNVSIKQRTQAMAHKLAKYGLRSVAVLHSDSKYGRETEAAFRERYLGQEPEARYRPLQYDTSNFAKEGPYLQIKQVLQDRPEGLGIFGTRSEIQVIANLLSEVNTSLTPYHPIMFTPIDFRPHYFGNDKLFSVSLEVSPQSDAQEVLIGDVEVLTHDTVILLLDQLSAGNIKTQKKAFHNRLVDVLSGLPQAGTKTITEMKFRQGHNDSSIRILSRNPSGALHPVISPTYLDLVKLKVSLLFDTRGWWVIGSLLVILIIPTILSILDLKSWFKGSWKELLGSLTVWGFITFNILVVGALYFYLAETGRVPYDSPITALVIAMAPTTLLKSTLFNTKTGKAIGLSTVYGKTMKWLNNQLMIKKYRSQQKIINILAYYNTLSNLKDKLAKVYANARPSEEKYRLTAQLQMDIDEAETHLDKRSVCARRLYETFKWEKLREFVPEEFDKNDPPDPDAMIDAAHQYVKALPLSEQNEIMKPVIEIAQQTLREKYEGEDINYPVEKQTRVFHCVQFLVQYCFYGKDHLVSAKLLPENWVERSLDSEGPNSSQKKKQEGDSKLADLVVQLTKRFVRKETNVK